MTQAVPRLRMFAGPNGSGKSTIKSVIAPSLLGVYINPDEIEKEIRQFDFLDLTAYGAHTSADAVLPFFCNSPLLIRADLVDEAAALRFNDGKLIFHEVAVNAYFASVAADFLRQALLAAGVTFTFETVMSSPDKVAFLKKAQARGFRTYLYYVATEDPDINISRVENRVQLGGHPVPQQKIIERYYRSLGLLFEAVQHANRAYIFDNSFHGKVWLAEVTDGNELEMKSDTMPHWFETALWDKFLTLESDGRT
ncbi:MAG: zeta toxin family protein [Rhodocyclaceae bacterium]|nr:zeta toxin family protein [Rhodocyclaceae bacterium]